MTFWIGQNYGDNKRISGCDGFGWGGGGKAVETWYTVHRESLCNKIFCMIP